MNFDKVIMNPPYMRARHLKIFDETYKHLNKNGCCVNLSPSTWIAKHNNNRPIAKYRKIFNGRIKDIEIIDHTREAVVRENDKKVYAVLYFNSENERKNFLNSLDTVFMNWYWQMFVVPGDNKIISSMFRMSDYTDPWTDARFYKLFNISEDEQKIIKETVIKYK